MSGNNRGQAMVEFALVIPFFLILVFGIVDFGMVLRSYVQITNAAREGARYGVTCKSDSAIKTTVSEQSSNLLTTSDVTVLANPCQTGTFTGSAGDPVEVKATYNYSWISPLGKMLTVVLPDPLPLSSTTKMRIE